MVFPVISLSIAAGRLGLAEDKEYGDQTKAIHLFVNQINQAGGIHGRKINPMIVTFDPTDQAEHDALCASSGPRAARRSSPSSTPSGRGRATTSSA